jgi:proline iminopeptidase
MKNLSVSCFLILMCFLWINFRVNDQPAVEKGLRKINGVDLYCEVIGRGEPIVVIHGGPGLDHSYFLPQMDELAGRHRLIFYDQRASGKSAGNLDRDAISLDLFVEDIEGVRRSFHLEKMNLMAHSWGGILAMQYAIRHSDRLKSLILVDSVGASSEDRTAADKSAQQRMTEQDFKERAAILQSDGFRKREPAAIESLFRLGFRATFHNRQLADNLTLKLPANFAANSVLLQNLGKDLTTYDFYNALRSVACPTLIIYGDSDPLPEKAAQRLQNIIPDSRLVILKDCGHFPFVEAPAEFFGAVRHFLDGLSH